MDQNANKYCKYQYYFVVCVIYFHLMSVYSDISDTIFYVWLSLTLYCL